MTMVLNSVPLNEHISVTSGAHILYFYDELEDYLDNAASFILTGFQQDQHVIFIDDTKRYEKVVERLNRLGYGHLLNRVAFIESEEFYLLSKTFHFEEVYKNFVSAVHPFIETKTSVRAWGRVSYEDQEKLVERLHAYECKCDLAINQLDVLTVCAYSAKHVTASLQNSLLKCHEYMMTDKELVRSSLYKKAGISVIFPSLSEHTKMLNEVDLYKQKLDFVHVVSHEVRNPLTVIKAYATMLLQDKDGLQLNENAARKLAEIQDYVAVIDNEITHIINTEQMLSSEALWRMSPVMPLRVIQEVLEIIRVKARTQGIEVLADVRMSGTELITCNKMGLRLVISNLLSNAVKYSFEQSTIEFKAEVVGDSLRLIVKDEGIGISKEQQSHLFQKYQKMNTEKSGQGIGLFMVKKLVDHFRGDIQLESEYGRGTTVQLLLPLIK